MRFSLRALLALTCVAAAISCLYFVVPNVAVVGIVLVALAVLPAALITGVIYARGYVRAFMIGAMTSAAWTPFYYFYFLPVAILDSDFTNPTDLFDISDKNALAAKVAFAVQAGLLLLTGMAAVGVRKFCLWAAQRTAVNTNASTTGAMPTIAIEPRDKAELYTILQGRVAAAGGVSASDGATVGH